jgi:3,4-dihydroxy 2-butanone 4-phosphate synthase/GTP cyclohydrolase II
VAPRRNLKISVFGFFIMSVRTARTTAFAPIETAIAAYRRGEMIVVVDDETRENEGDVIVAAERATPAAINFMIREARGLVCIAMSRERLERLGLSRMAPSGSGDALKTAFMESVDARDGVTTGISAFDRARTVRVLLDDASVPDDLVRPGHLFPLAAVEHGVLRRPGHTEAAVDLARLAGLKPAGVICEVTNPDGSMARLASLRRFARRHRLLLVSIGDLIVHRRNREVLVACERTIRLPTEAADFQLKMYRSLPENDHHLALRLGPIRRGSVPLVRVHSECLTGDVFGSMRCDCGAQLRRSMAMIAEAKAGLIVYLRQEGRGIGLAHKIHAYALQDRGLDTVEANLHLGFGPDLRDYSAAAQILRDLGVRRVRLITNNPRKIEGLRRYGIEVVARVPLVIPATSHNARYLRTKKAKLGHMI